MPFHGIKSYRGQLDDGGQDKIRLTTTDGRMGYKVIKFQILPPAPGATTHELVGKIYTMEQTTVTGTVDFSDSTLLAAAIFAQSSDSFNSFHSVIFDNSIVNQDMYVTIDDSQNAAGANYYIELEQIKLTAAQAEVLIVKDLRVQPWTRP